MWSESCFRNIRQEVEHSSPNYKFHMNPLGGLVQKQSDLVGVAEAWASVILAAHGVPGGGNAGWDSFENQR